MADVALGVKEKINSSAKLLKLHPLGIPLAKTLISRHLSLTINAYPYIMICVYPLALAQRSESRVKFI